MSMNATVIDGKAIAQSLRKKVLANAESLAAEGWAPKLVSVSVGDTAASDLYVRNQQKSAAACGIGFKSACDVAGWATPVFGGVGPVTVATLMQNAKLAARMQQEHYISTYGATEERGYGT